MPDTSTISKTQVLAVEANWLWAAGKLLTSGQADRVVGIADRNWMNSRVGPDVNGEAECGANAVFVVDGRWDTVSHEIGHTYELNHPGETNCTLLAGIRPTDGYWVEQGRAIRGLRSLMTGGSLLPRPFPSPDRWIARDDYERVFANYFRTSPVDPEVLLVSGLLHKDGRVEWAPFYRLPSGIIDEASPGDFSIQVLDAAGNILYDRPFDVQFALLFDTNTGPDVGETDVIAFGFAVPYPPEAAAVQVQQNGQTLARTAVTTRLLRDAVESIPDRGFVKNQRQRRQALLHKIDALDAHLTLGDLQGARSKLQNDIRKHIVAWLVADYPTQSPLEYTQPALLDLIDELIGRLGGAPPAHSTHSPVNHNG